jgi:glycosyltransferase involved in cell wall biosynthesis
LADRLAGTGYPVITSSSCRNKISRLVDILKTLFVNRHQIDIQVLQVYSGLSFITTDLASLLGKKLGHKLIFHIHGGAFPEFVTRYPRWVRYALNRADAIIVPSPFLGRCLEGMGYSVQVIPNGIDLSDYHYRHRQQLQPLLLWMRAFHPIYNPEMAVRVFSIIRRTYPLARLVMAGQDKGLQTSVQHLAQELNVFQSIKFPGFLDTAAKIREGDRAEIFLNTNHIDNMPVSLLEACAMGLPIVATRVGGIPDLVQDRHTALLVDSDKDEQMVQAVMELLENPALAGTLSSNGRQLAENSSWEQILVQWEILFSQLMKNNI